MNPLVEAFFDKATGTISYVAYDEPGGHAAIIDPVLDYNPKSGHTTTASADKLIRFVRKQACKVDWILETHVHADHLSAAYYLKQSLGGKVSIGEQVRQVQEVFKRLFNLDEFTPDGSQFDHLFAADENFRIEKLDCCALFVPGHTPADMAYRIGDTVFVGDTIFMPDVGTARCDFPGGDARALYRSIRKLFALPPETRLFMCHDYPPPGRTAMWETTVAAQRAHNIHVRESVTEDDFASMRQARDAGLEMPTLILSAIQVNIRAGAMPVPERNGVSYLKIPINVL
ncbi:MAG TPA: MBL fold metallo-hydrolase [Burkholderiaceae bacterium]|nr:MBL fold metallo-hydrolase [Burkholderiaceae bacterium]